MSTKVSEREFKGLVAKIKLLEDNVQVLERRSKENAQLQQRVKRLEEDAELHNRLRREERLKRIRLERAFRKWRRRWENSMNIGSTLVTSTPAVQRHISPITPIPRNATPAEHPPSRTRHFSDNDTSGSTFLSSFEASLRNLPAQGDQDLEVIIAALKEQGLSQIKQWRPKKPEIVRNKSKIIKWILHPANVHKFKDTDLIYTTSAKKSVWLDLVNNLNLNQGASSRAKLIAYFGNTSKGASFFGGFVTAVVRVHNSKCRQCGLQG